MPPVKPEDVAAFDPLAPPVTQAQVDAASDWAEGVVERARAVVPDPGTRQGRDFQRAICAYTLALAGGAGAQAARMNAGDGEVLKGVKLGPLEESYAVVDAESVAGGMTSAASARLAEAGRYLLQAGIRIRTIVVGASR